MVSQIAWIMVGCYDGRLVSLDRSTVTMVGEFAWIGRLLRWSAR